MTIESFTNSALRTFRRCPREFYLRYVLRLEPDREESTEARDVGSVWHAAHDLAAHATSSRARLEAGCFAVRESALDDLWREKLCRLFVAHDWYWSNQGVDVEESERRFCCEVAGARFEGVIDAVVALPGGRRGIMERKTTSADLSAGSAYWEALRLDAQVSIYAEAVGFVPDAIVYDVLRKPTISPKRVSQRDLGAIKVARRYHGEVVTDEDLAECESTGRETVAMYGARLTADVADRPDYYFARREVPRMEGDRVSLLSDLRDQVDSIGAMGRRGGYFRNPDACGGQQGSRGRCPFVGLCGSNACPDPGDAPPDGFRARALLHPELGG